MVKVKSVSKIYHCLEIQRNKKKYKEIKRNTNKDIRKYIYKERMGGPMI